MNIQKLIKIKSQRNILLFKGDSFDINFITFVSKKEILDKFWMKKIFSTKDTDDITHRTINHWDTIGLISDDRKDKQKWRKFNVLELVWIHIIKELRKFDFSNKKILNVKKSLIGLKANNNNYPLFEYYLSVALLQKIPVNLIVFYDGICEIATKSEFETSRYFIGIEENFINIDINKILQEIFYDKDLNPKYNFIELSKKELKIIERIREGRYKNIEIKLKDGEIKTLRSTETIKNREKIVNIIQQDEYQTIKINTEKGKSVSIDRTKKEKL